MEENITTFADLYKFDKLTNLGIYWMNIIPKYTTRGQRYRIGHFMQSNKPSPTPEYVVSLLNLLNKEGVEYTLHYNPIFTPCYKKIFEGQNVKHPLLRALRTDTIIFFAYYWNIKAQHIWATLTIRIPQRIYRSILKTMISFKSLFR